QPDLVLAKRLAMSCGGILLVRRAITNMAVEDDKSGPALSLTENVERVLDALDIVGVADAQHIPPIAEKPGGDVLGEGDARIAFDRDVVVVIEPAEIIEAEVASQRRCLRGHPLHHASVAADGVDAVVEDRRARPVVAAGQPLLSDGHANARRHSLPQRPGRGLHARSPMIFGMSWRLAVELTEALDVLERDRGLAQPLVIRIHGAGAGQKQ